MMKEAMHWHLEGKYIACTLCPHMCKIREGGRGICSVRVNKNGKLYSLIYERPSSVAVDPVEKKGLFHVFPGSQCLSFGTAGCNLGCLFCQNSSLSQVAPESLPNTVVHAEDIPKMCRETGSHGVAWTYNEPVIWHEWALEGARALKRDGYYTVYKSNGYINEEPLKEISPYLDVMSVDIKSFNSDFYRRITKSKLQSVLDTCVRTKELGMHMEITYLVIPTLNDSTEELKAFSKWIVDNLGVNVPLHLTAFHPDYKMLHIPRTSLDTLLKAHKIAREEGMNFVYVGNVSHPEYENTYCPSCKAMLIKRDWFRIKNIGMEKNKCIKCGYTIPMIGEPLVQISSVPRHIFN